MGLRLLGEDLRGNGLPGALTPVVGMAVVASLNRGYGRKRYGLLMALEVPQGVEVASYERVEGRHALEVSWPLPGEVTCDCGWSWSVRCKLFVTWTFGTGPAFSSIRHHE